MYINEKMRPVETVLGMGEEGIKNDRGGEFNYDSVKSFVNVTMYPQYNNNLKKGKKFRGLVHLRGCKS
jgi:hypothetical protein